MKNRQTISRPSDSTRASLFTPVLIFILYLCFNALLHFYFPSLSRAQDRGEVIDDSGNQSSSQSWWGDLDLDEAVARLTETLVEQGKLKDQPVLISPHDLYDAKTGLSLPLATQLRGRLITEMKRQGVRALLPGADEDKFMILQGTWQKQGNDLGIDLKVMKLGPYGPEAVASASEKVPLKKIDTDALTPDRESWARYLVRKLEQNTPDQNSRKVHLRDFKVKSKKASSDLGPYLTGWLRPALAEGRMFVPLDQQRALRGLSANTLRTRGTRAIRPDLPGTDAGTSLTADLLKADGEIKGVAWLHEKKVEVQVRVISRQGQQITAASADIPSGLFPGDLLKPDPSTAVTAPPALKTGAEGISKGGLRVELTTTRGEGRPLYRKGEHIRFLLRLNRSAWVYLFDLDPKGKATLLYPVDENGRLDRSGKCGAIPPPGTPLILPEDGCSYDLMVTEPYGTDRVWAVAVESPIEFPADLKGDWAKSDFLVKRLRDQGLSKKGAYAEAEVELVTGP
ncbi:MAG: DUF4384 domain-containing protein [Deltaproteobacteria bacterium]|nr:DUF4384 domain-containing protein [Deltaproteobacteria bacterium]